MSTLKIAICEDSTQEQNKILDILEKSEIPTETEIFTCGEDFLCHYIPGKYDLVLMDIYMGEITGVETVTRLRQLDEKVPVAFVTTSTDFALESYRLDAVKYIEKPVKAKAVTELMLIAQLYQENTPRLIYKANGKEQALAFDRIIYAEQMAHSLVLHLTEGETLQINDRLDKLENQFIDRNFIRSHKSYMVNLAYVKAFDRELMVFNMKEGQNVHIRRESLSKAKKAFEDYLFREARGLEDE